jgi:hypothetical protein
MAKTKLTIEQKLANKHAEEAARLEQCWQSDVKERLKQVAEGKVSKPTRSFEVGEQVEYGNFISVHIDEVLADGLVYTMKVIVHASRDHEQHEDRRVAVWHDIFPYRAIEEKKAIPQFHNKFYFGQTFNQAIDSILHSYYYFGIDLNPSYQRGNVWSLEDKVSLIDSIFNDIEIGRIVLMKRPYEDRRNHMYEMIDGKQRLTTLLEFYEDRFEYKGLKFSQMHPADQGHFGQKQMAVIEAPEMSEQEILEYFIRVNTSGRPVNPEHLDKVKNMIKK